VDRRLGQGAFGVVYRAYDFKRQSCVALKTLRLVDPAPLFRFKQEFRSLADVQHPNLVRLYELLSDGEQWFFTMELIEGTDFLSYVAGRSGALPSDNEPTEAMESGVSNETVSIATAKVQRVDTVRLRSCLKQLGEGLNALHDSGKLHRDIKPSNVLVTGVGRVVILDFGLVKDLAGGKATTGLIVGTPVYMSPEQGADLPVGTASDWYSVGVMLYEALTGRLPFSGSSTEVLKRKLKVDPPRPEEVASHVPPDLSGLCAALLRRDPEARPTGLAVLSALGTNTRAPTIESSSIASQPSAFVGRAEHLKALLEAFHATRSGGVTVLVHGSSGMGKSTLVQHFLEGVRRSAPEAVVLTGRCYEQESLPYKGMDSLMDAMSSYLKELPEPEQESLLPRDVLALARLFPVLRQAPAVARPRRRPDIADSLELRRCAFAALRELLARLAARQPVVLFIDDLHWSDLDSVLLLDEICSQPDAPELLLVVAYRTEEAETSPSLKAFLESFRSGPGRDVRELAVSQLPPEEAKALAEVLAREADELASDGEAIARESGGSPFFVHQLVRHHEFQRRSGQPADTVSHTTLDEVIGAHLTRLSPAARTIAQLLATAGRPVDRGVLANAARLNDYAEALDSLRDQHVTRTRSAMDTEPIELYHARIGDSIRIRMTTNELRARHAALAAAFEASEQADPETLFFHFFEAGDQSTAGRYITAAAAQAAEALAFDRAARLYRKAIELGAPSEDALHIRLGDALANAGRGKEAARAYLSAAQTASRAQRVELQRLAYDQLLRSGHIDEGLSVLREVLSALDMKLPETPGKALLSMMAGRLYLKFRGLGFRERNAAYVPVDELLRVDVCRSVAQGLGIVDHIRGADFQARHLIFALRAGEVERIARALGFEVAFNANAGQRRRDRTDQLRSHTARLVGRVQTPQAVAEMNLSFGLAAYLLGEWHQAVDYLQEAEKILMERCTGVAAELNSARNFLLRTYAWRGDLKRLSDRLPGLLRDASERDDLYAATILGVRNSFIPLLTVDDAAGAHEAARRAIERWPQTGFHTVHYIYFCVATEIDLYSGDALAAWKRILEGSRPLRRSLILRVQFARIESAHLRARCALAVAAMGGHDAEAFVKIAERDIKRIERESTRWGSPLARLIRAGIAVWRGERPAAAGLLATAAQEFQDCEMALYAAATRRRCGELMAGEEGRALVAAADEWMSDQRIVNPARMTAMLIPGRWP
jgi:serine/threonine protein kinase